MTIQLNDLLAEMGIAETVEVPAQQSQSNPIPVPIAPLPTPATHVDGLQYPVVDPNWIMPDTWHGAKRMFETFPRWLNCNRAVFALLTGPTGTGKSHAIQQFCALLNRPMLPVACNRDMTETSLFAGTQEIASDGSSQWTDGPFVRAAKHNAVLVLEEINNLHPSTQMSMQSRTDRDSITITIPQTGKTIQWQQPIVFGACNEGYAGTSDITQAIRDRFETIETSYLSPKSEIELLCKRTGIAKPIASRAVKTANAIRAASAKGELTYDCSPRALLSFCLATQCGEKPEEAWENSVIFRIPNLQHTIATREAVYRISEAVGNFKYGRKTQ